MRKRVIGKCCGAEDRSSSSVKTVVSLMLYQRWLIIRPWCLLVLTSRTEDQQSVKVLSLLSVVRTCCPLPGAVLYLSGLVHTNAPQRKVPECFRAAERPLRT